MVDSGHSHASAFLEAVQYFIDREVAPREVRFQRQLEATGAIPADEALAERRALRRKSAEAGLYAAAFPESVGGGGLDVATIAQAYRIVGASGLVLADRGGVLPNVEGPQPSMLAMDRRQRTKYLTPLIEARLEGCLALTESVAGSDAGRIQTTARRDGDDWVINGSKQFITHAAHADFVQVVAVTDTGDPARRHTIFLVERDTPGFVVGAQFGTLGEDRPVVLHLDDVRVPSGAIVGGVGGAMPLILGTIGRARLNLAALALGKSQFLLGRMLEHASQREAFGQPIGAFQHVQRHIVDSSVEIELGLGMLDRAAQVAHLTDHDANRMTATLKIHATESLSQIADRAVQVFGGLGVTHAGGIERFYRDARAMRIYEGTTELLRSNIARWLGLPR